MRWTLVLCLLALPASVARDDKSLRSRGPEGDSVRRSPPPALDGRAPGSEGDKAARALIGERLEAARPGADRAGVHR